MRDKDTQALLRLVIHSDYTPIGLVLEIPPHLQAIVSIDNIVAVDTILSQILLMPPTTVGTGRLHHILILLTVRLALCLEAQTLTGFLLPIMNQYQTVICERGEGRTLMESMIIVELIVAVKRKSLTMDHTVIGVLVLYLMDRVCRTLIVMMVGISQHSQLE